jgi:hypothetical protein
MRNDKERKTQRTGDFVADKLQMMSQPINQLPHVQNEDIYG